MSREIADINMASIAFSKQKVKSSNKFLYVYSEKKPLVVKLPVMRIPFGLQKDKMSNKDQYILDLSFGGEPDLLAGFRALDDAIIKKAHSEFYSDASLDEIRGRYVSCIKESNNPDFAPTLRVKIITDEAGEPKCNFYDFEKEDGKYPKVDTRNKGGETYLLERMRKGTSHETIVECIGLWFFNDKFGLSFKCSQVLLYPFTAPQTEECGFLSSDDESSNEDADFLGE
jgi:hypothetical protein